jgi:hypothetical protein
MLERLPEATDLPVTTRKISTEVAATAAGMNDSPTLLINGRDPFPNPNLQDCDCGVACRIYRDEHGRVVPAQFAQEILGELSWTPVTGQSIAAERSGWDDIVLRHRLLDALRRFNPEAVHERHQETRAEELEAVGAGRVLVGQ